MEEFKQNLIKKHKEFKNAFFKEVKLGKYKKPVYLTFIKKSDELFDFYVFDKKTEQQIAEIRNRISANLCNILLFKVDYDLQQMGIGKSLFNLSCAYAQSKGVSRVQGVIYPIGGIKGLPKRIMVYEEYKALKEIYSKLGTVVTESAHCDAKFAVNFENCNRFQMLKGSEQAIMMEILLYEKELNKK